MMVSATKGNPTLFMHKRVYFRIANKEHYISSPGGLFDNETVLTATHLLDESRRTTTEALRTLPVDYKTITKLEEDYPDQFDWKNEILPKIHTLVRELFGGMTAAYPAMEKSTHSRAIYGIDVMFEIDDSSIEPRLTEVTFCPASKYTPKKSLRRLV
jgi:Tubulin-tyrosine ligase family